MLHQQNRARMSIAGLSAALLLPALAACGSIDETGPAQDEAQLLEGAAQPLSGNGAPSGAHFNLNIIGTKTKTGVDASGGGRIFVPLVGSTKIQLAEGDDFAVVDGKVCFTDLAIR